MSTRSQKKWRKYGGNPFFVPEDNGGDQGVSELKQRSLEDSYYSEETQKLEGEEPLKLVFSTKRLILILGATLLFFLIIFTRIVYLQIIKGSYYFALAESNRVRVEVIKAERGVIYDRKGEQLVENMPFFKLEVIPADLPKSPEERQDILTKVNELTPLDFSEIDLTLEQAPSFSYRPLPLKDDLSYEEAVMFKVKEAEFPGIQLKLGYRRHYLTDNSLAHVLGYIGKITQTEVEADVDREYLLTDYLGKTGLELYYEKELKGRDGKKQIEVDALGQELKVISQALANPGFDLVLSLNNQLQEICEEELLAGLRKSYSQRGAVIALDPQSGEILALVNIPYYDNNEFARGISQESYQELIEDSNRPLFARAWSGEYPSGSTIKPIFALAALEEGIITPQTGFTSVGGIWVSRWFFPDWKAGGHGYTNVYKAIAESVNTFFYYISGGAENFTGLGLERMVEWSELFGLGSKLSLDLPGERPGFVPTQEWKERVKEELWYIGDTYHFGIGQGDVLVTPLQVASWTSVFANGGTLWQPHLVQKFISRDRGEKMFKLKALRENFASKANVEVVRGGLRRAVTEGSARRLSLLPFSAAGKTGTAQWSTKKKSHSWFTGFAPFEDPEIVITVLIEEGGEGSESAVPVAYEILKRWGKSEN